MFMVCAAPDVDWTWLCAARRPLDAAERAQRNVGKRQRIVASHKLYDVGLRLMDSAERPQ